jgi:hypothetical protein
LNPAHQDLSNNTKCTFQSLRNFQLGFNLIFSEEINHILELLHHKSKHHETKLVHPSSLIAFQRDQECDLKYLRLVDLISTNKTKQTTFIDRCTFFLQVKKKSHPMYDQTERLGAVFSLLYG